MLFGIFATHSPESCPMHNKTSQKIFVELKDKIDLEMKKYNITKVVDFYMSVLEHDWIIIVDAVHAHEVEQLCIGIGIGSMSTIKIVPMNLYETARKKMVEKK